LPNDNLQSPSKKLKDGNFSRLPPLLGREPWYPEEEIFLESETADNENSTAGTDAALPASTESSATDAAAATKINL
jgi:hypothetical protein